MLWRNERKLLKVVLRVKELIDQVSVAKTQMLTASKQLGFAAGSNLGWAKHAFKFKNMFEF